MAGSPPFVLAPGLRRRRLRIVGAHRRSRRRRQACSRQDDGKKGKDALT